MAHRRRFGRIRKLSSGRWQARYPDARGALVPAPHTFPTKTAADRYLAGVETDIGRGTWFDPRAGQQTLRCFADQWLPARRVKGGPLAPRTREVYRWQLDRHILPVLGEVELRRLDAAVVRSWHATMTGPAGPGASTTAKCYRLLRAICNTAVADGELIRNPCAITGAGDENSAERPAVSIGQVYALADAVGPRWRALVLLAAFCGLRFGELAALTVGRLDLLHGTVSVAASASELTRGVRHVGPPKSVAGRRTIAIPDVITSDLQGHVARFAQRSATGLVFVGPRGGRLRNANFGRSVWRPAVRSLGLHGLHFHDLRGCAATLAAITGATTAELMHRLGHATPDVALRYQRATADRDVAIAKALSELVTTASVAPLSTDADPGESISKGHAGGTERPKPRSRKRRNTT
jgi:integrase